MLLAGNCQKETDLADKSAKPGSGPASGPGEALEYGLLSGLLGYRLRRAQQTVFADFAAAFSGDAVTPGQLGLLALIRENPGISQSALARAVGIERATLGEVMERFVQRGLVSRRRSPTDRRSFALELSPAGAALYKTLIPKVRAHERRISEHLTADEHATLMALLGKMSGDPG